MYNTQIYLTEISGTPRLLSATLLRRKVLRVFLVFFRDFWHFFSKFGKSEETEISDDHLGDCWRVLVSEIGFLTYNSLVFTKNKIYENPSHFY